ncbi:MAG: hypothetical protein Q4P66_07560 [Actinomycetaceae bacterium]|nr:hypothetical protein [Actinomycetaceae bacterium]
MSFSSTHDHTGDLEELSTGRRLEEFCPLLISQLTKVLQRYETNAKQAIENNAKAGDS